MPKMLDLGTFDDRDVRSATVAITNAGDGLSQAMKVDPQVLHIGDKVFVVLECEVSKVRHEPIEKDGSDLTRVHVLRAGNATMVDGKLVSKALNETADRIQKARDELTGAQALGLDYDPLGVGDGEKKTAKKTAAKKARKSTKKAPVLKVVE